MSIEDDVALLERVPTLRLLGMAALRMLAIGSEQRDGARGDTLFNAGDDGDAAALQRDCAGTFIGDPGRAQPVSTRAGKRSRRGASATRRIRQPNQPDRQRYPDGGREAEYLAKRRPDSRGHD